MRVHFFHRVSRSWKFVALFGVTVAAFSCAAEDPDRVDRQPLEPGALIPADPVFSSGGSDGSTGGSGSGVGASNAILPPDASPFGDDTFEQYIDPPRVGSQYCGDGAYDPALEECDDGIGAELDLCTPACQTRDILAVPPAPGGQLLSRKLGLGRHPITGGHLGSALSWIDASAAPQVVLQLRDVHGNRSLEVVVADATLTGDDASQPTLASHPVVATLPDGTHVVAYGDLNGDGSELGVALRTVSHLTGTLGELRYANETIIGAQHDPDLIWTEEGLIVAWVDTSDDQSGPDIRFRIFDEDLGAGPEETLAGTELPEGAVTLSTASGSAAWAAAWRRGEADGTESIVISRGGQTVAFTPQWEEGSGASAGAPHSAGGGSNPNRLMPGHIEDRLGLAPLAEDLFAVAFTVGTDPEDAGVANVFRLWVAVVDFSLGEVVWIGPVEPLVADAPDETHSQRSPTLADASPPHLPGASGQVFLGWRAEAELGDSAGEELWLKRLNWDEQAGALSLNEVEVPLTRDEASRPGDQRQLAFANLPVPGGHALSMAWEDWGVNFDSTEGEQARPDVVVQVAPVPLRRDENRLLDCAYAACGLGLGPCELDDDCAGGLICAEGRGPWYGYSPEIPVCAPETCTNGERDAGEAGVDCGGECGPCFECESPSSSLGTAHYCSAVCQCENTEGDCDSDYDCVRDPNSANDLTCVESVGDLMGWPGPLDLCLRAQCTNEVQDPDEDWVDCGGPSCPACLDAIPLDCSVTPCTEGQAGCNSTSECAAGLVCATGQGELYGYASGTNACVPAGCETGRGGAFSATACSEDCPCGSGVGQCSGNSDCLAGQCAPDRGIYYGQDSTISVCVPDQCFNGQKDANETRVDCGGPCGRECPVCPGDSPYRSFEYPADSSQPSGAQGWEVLVGSGITWQKSTEAEYGAESLEFGGSGVATLRSPEFSGSAFEVLGGTFFVDLALLDGGGWWAPGIEDASDLKIGIYHPSLGTKILIDTAFAQNPSGDFVRQSAPLPPELFEAIALDWDGFQLEVQINMPAATTGPILRLDYMQLGGENAVFRSICQDDPLPGNPDGDLFGFEDAGLWSSAETNLSLVPSSRQGVSAVATDLLAQGASPTITSASFDLGDSAMSKLLLDILLPSASSSATVTLSLACDSNDYQQQDSEVVAATATGQWVTVPFTLPGLMEAMSAGATDCTIEIAANGNAAGTIVYDDLRFVPDTHCSTYLQLDDAPFAVGTTANGTATSPYRLCNAQQIQSLMDTSSLWNKNFVLEADIDLTDVTGQIGNLTTNFTGTFDGNQHYLSNYELSGGDYAGLFRRVHGDGLIDGVSDGEVKHLTLADFVVSGTSYVGSLAGYANNARITGIYVAGGTVTATGHRVGGLLGEANNCFIEGSVATAAVSSDGAAVERVGGLVGDLSGSTIEDSRATGDVVAGSQDHYVGGLVGIATSGGVIRRSSAHGNVVSLGNSVGGLVGRVQAYAKVERSLATGDVSGGTSVGGLAGLVKDVGPIGDSSASGHVSAVSSGGGLVGTLEMWSSITDSWATGAVQADNIAGGLVGGSQTLATVTRSYARGSVESAGDHAGGLVGHAYDTTLTDVFASGGVVGTQYSAGGLVGLYESVTLVRGHSVGAVTLTGDYRGTVASRPGANNVVTTFTSTYGSSTANPGVNAIGSSPSEPGATNLTAAQFRDPSNFTGWDFFSVWEMGENYPELRRSACELYEQIDEPPFLVGMATQPNGTALHPYRLCNAAQIQHIMDNPGSPGAGLSGLWDSNYLLESDIDLSEVVGQIGTATQAFRGTFDGAGRKLSNYTRIEPSAMTVGLFGDSSFVGSPDGYLDGEIKNLVVDNFQVSGTQQVGMLIGRNRGVVRNVTVKGGSVTGSLHTIGGVVGQNYGQIDGVRAEGLEVHCGSSSCGGVVGQNYGGTIIDSHTLGGRVHGPVVGTHVGGLTGDNRGQISGSSASTSVEAPLSANVGGLVGYQYGAGVSIIQCSSSGPVRGNGKVGGLVGLSSGNALTAEAFATGFVQGTEDVGGLMGRLAEGTIEASEATGNVIGTTVRVGGFAGWISSTSSIVSGSRATGKAEGAQHVGGFAGRITSGFVRDSEAEGNAFGTGSYVGGFVGYADNAVIQESRAVGDATSTLGGWTGGFAGASVHAQLTDVFAFGDANGNGVVGGLVGGSTGNAVTIRGIAHGSATSTANYAGGLIGYFRGPSEVHDSVAYGDVIQTGGWFAGGLIGNAFQGSAGERNVVSLSKAFGNVTAIGVTGGLVGSLSWSTVSDSAAHGRVKSGSALGGLIGSAVQSVIERSHSTGVVNSEASSGPDSGGLIGQLFESTLLDSYSTGGVNSNAPGGTGGLIGEARASEVRRSYSQRGKLPMGSHGLVLGAWLDDPEEVTFESVYGNIDENPTLQLVAGRPDHAGVAGLTEAQIRQQSSFAGWDFENVWQMGSNGPILRDGYCIKNEQLDVPPFVAVADGEEAPTGGLDDPYVLCNASQIAALAASSDAVLLGRHFRVAQSIPLGAVEGQIGDASTPFTGTFDGGGHELFNYAPGALTGDAGLFGVVQGDGIIDGTGDGHIHDVVLVDAVLTGTDRVGALVGHLKSGFIEDVEIVDATVSGTTLVGGVVGLADDGSRFDGVKSSGQVEALTSGQSVGGLVGHLDGGALWDSHSTANVQLSGSYAGGLLGQATDSALSVCSATGSVQATNYAGGLVGLATNTSVTRCWATGAASATGSFAGGLLGGSVDGLVNDSYATGNVGAVTTGAGGLIGDAQGTSVSRTYATGTVTGGGTTGGLIGTADGDLYLSASFGSSAANGSLALVGNGTAQGSSYLTDEELTDWSNFQEAGWVFGTIWASGEEGPTLNGGGNVESEPCLAHAQSDVAPFLLGMEEVPDGTPDKPWPLCNAAQIVTVMGNASYWDDHFVLHADISLAGVVGQIGTSSTGFIGSFDGGGHTLSGYTANVASSNGGLFARVGGTPPVVGRISNLKLVDFDVTGQNLVGALAGQVDAGSAIEDIEIGSSTEVEGTNVVGIAVGQNRGTLARVSASGTVSGSSEVGGLVGENGGGFIEGCSSSAHVTGSVQSIGGLVGSATTNGAQAPGGRIGKSTATGRVDGGTTGVAVGGLVGYLFEGLAYGSSASGPVDGGTYVGGLIGALAHDDVISRVYGSRASGAVSGTQAVGGLVGGTVQGVAQNARGVIERSSANGAVSASTNLAGGLVGFATDIMIKDAQASGAVTAPAYAGGLVGLAYGGQVINSLAAGEVTGSMSGALAASSGADFFNSFALESEDDALDVVGDGSAALGAEFASASDLESAAFLTAAGWDTENIWEFTPSATLRDDGGELPFCERYTPTNEAPFISETEEAPAGTQSDPYKICTSAQLAAIANDSDLLSGHYELATHIDLSSFDDQIGTGATPFSGTFEGKAYLLHDFDHVGVGTETGLFGVVSGDGVSSGVIRGVNLSRFDVDGAGKVGTLVGELLGGLLEAVQVRGSSVSGTAEKVGGLVGDTTGTIRDSGVDVSVSLTTGKRAGGVAGFNRGLIENVRSAGDVAITSTEGGTVRPIGGLVGEMTSGTIRDCVASGSVTSVGDRAGGMVGDLGGGELVDSLATGDVTIEGTFAGGLVGLLDSTVRNSRATGDVLAGTKRAGGLVGQAHNGAVIEDAHAYGDVECPLETGGLLGYLATSGANIYRSSAHGHVFGESEVGGLIGDGNNETSGQGIVSDCYAEGVAFATNYRVGGLFGRADMLTVSSSYARNAVNDAPGGEHGAIAGINESDTSTFAAVYYDFDTSNVPAVGSGSATGISSASFNSTRNQSTYAGWDFTNVWEMAFDGPRLRSEELPLEFCDEYGQSQSVPFTTGTGTAGSSLNPYRICTGAQLAAAMASSTYWDKYLILEADVSMQSLSGQLGSTATAFTGIFDGKRHQVVNYSNTGTATDVGLFGHVSGNGASTGIVTSIVMGDSSVSGASNVGAFVGRSVGGILLDLFYSDSTVTGTGSGVGGIVGWSSGSIDGVWADGAVNGTGSASEVGGVVGYSSGTITGAVATNAVDLSGSGGDHIGGLVGRAYGGTITDSHSYGEVYSDVGEAGGLAGEADVGVVFNQCSASGDVTVTGTAPTGAGGLIGRLVGGSELLSCWAEGAVTGYRRVGGLVGALGGATVTESFATGDANSSSYEVGGLIGYISTASGTAITRSYATGDATGTSRAGGFVGYMRAGSVADSYATGDADSSGSTGATGGFIGIANAITVTDCYAFGQSDLSSGNTNSGSFFGTRTDTTVTTSYAHSSVNSGLLRVGASGSVTGITGRTTAQFAVQSNLSGFNFTSVWVMDADAGRAVLQ